MELFVDIIIYSLMEQSCDTLVLDKLLVEVFVTLLTLNTFVSYVAVHVFFWYS